MGIATKARVRWRGLMVALGAQLVLAVGCSESSRLPGLPTTPAPPNPPVGAQPHAFPSLTHAGEIYVGPDNLYDFVIPTQGSGLASRFVLYADSTFSLQFSGGTAFEYLGNYHRADSLITFSWQGSSTAGPWGATGVLRGTALAVTYNDVMSASDFVSGVYVRSP